MLKVNEFTLAGAVLADSLGRGAGKKNGGEPTHSSPKSATFSKEYNTPAKNRADTVRPGYTTPMQSTGDGESLSYSLCLKVSSFQSKNKSDTQRAFALVLADTSKLFLDIKKAWS